MENKLYIRKACIEDLSVIIELFNSAIKNMNANHIPQWDEVYPNKAVLEEDILNQEMVVGVIGEQVVSAAVLNQDYDEEYNDAKWTYYDASYIIIHRFCVEPNYQNQGIGTRTLRSIEEYVHNKGIESIRLDAFSLNPKALHMYEKAGYVKTGVANWRKGLFYLYEKKLV
ncbi:MAG: sortase-like acyltransferase [Anaerocolumna sp.]|jgi:GNAT superfamily N-acetyltransferase|nr:sortase-like acyltransferase [Anaerocolumna sp.]